MLFNKRILHWQRVQFRVGQFSRKLAAGLKQTRKHLCALLLLTSYFCLFVWSITAEESLKSGGIIGSESFQTQFVTALFRVHGYKNPRFAPSRFGPFKQKVKIRSTSGLSKNFRNPNDNESTMKEGCSL